MAQGNKLNFKYLASGTLTDVQKTTYANDIVFVASEKAIYTHGVKYGISDEDATKITNLETAVEALKKVKHFGGIKVGSTTWTPATDGAALEIAGAGSTVVGVTNGKLTITGTDYTSSIADAKKAGTDAASALSTYQTSNDVAVKAAKDAADAAQDTADSKVASITAGNGIAVTGTTTPTVGVKIDTTTAGNVTLSTSANGLKAQVTIPEATVTGVAANDPILTLTNKLISADVTMDYVKADKKIYLYGKNKTTAISSIPVDDFILDGALDNVELVHSAESGITEATPYLKFTWNSAAGSKVTRISLKEFMDNVNFDGANLKLKALPTVTSYTAPKNGDSIDTAIANLAKGIADAKVAGVTSFSGQTGAITLKAAGTNNGSVNLSMNGKELSANIVGLKSAAFTESSAYATAAQGSTADTAVQNVQASNTGTYISVSASKSGTTINLAPSVTVQAVAGAGASVKGLAEASDVKNYVDSQLTWEEL